MTLFSGFVRTTDGRKWSVAFWALSWDDAYAIGNIFGAKVDGKLIATYAHPSLAPFPCLPHLFAWYFDGRRIYDNENITP